MPAKRNVRKGLKVDGDDHVASARASPAKRKVTTPDIIEVSSDSGSDSYVRISLSFLDMKTVCYRPVVPLSRSVKKQRRVGTPYPVSPPAAVGELK